MTCGLSDWSVWCDLLAPDGTTVGSIYGADTVEENEEIAKRVMLAVNAHETLVSALKAAKQLCDNINEFGRATDQEYHDAAEAKIDAALKQAEG